MKVVGSIIGGTDIDAKKHLVEVFTSLKLIFCPFRHVAVIRKRWFHMEQDREHWGGWRRKYLIP